MCMTKSIRFNIWIDTKYSYKYCTKGSVQTYLGMHLALETYARGGEISCAKVLTAILQFVLPDSTNVIPTFL